jgi:hypothetical protein
MRTKSSLLAVLASLSVCAASVWAEPDSGPEAGSDVKEFKVFAATGEQSGKEFDFTAERGDKPTIFVFVQQDKFSRPIGRYLKKLDDEVKDKLEDTRIVAVWLGNEAQKSKDYLPRVQMSIKLERTDFSVFEGDVSGPQGWGINIDAHVTTVVTKGKKVVGSIGYLSVNETDVPDVLKKLGK